MVNCERKFPSYCWPWILIKLIHSRPGSGTSTHWPRNQPIDLLLLKLSLNGLQSVRLRPAFDCFKWQNGHVSMTQCGRFWGIELVWSVIRLLVPPPNRWQVFLTLQPVWRGVGGGGRGRRWGGETDDVTFLACIEWHLEYQPFERCCVHFCIMPDGAYQK